MASLWRIDTVGTGPSGEEIVNVYHYDQADGGIVDPVDLATAFDTVVGGARLAVLSDAYTHNYTRALCIEGENLLRDGLSLALNGSPGSGGATSDNLWNAIVVKKLSAFAGRAGRGRNFIGPVDVSLINDEGTVSLGVDWAALGTALLTTLSVTLVEGPVVFKLLATRTFWATAKRLVVEIAFALIAGIQRRRRLRSGGT